MLRSLTAFTLIKFDTFEEIEANLQGIQPEKIAVTYDSWRSGPPTSQA